MTHPCAKKITTASLTANLIRINGCSYGVRLVVGDEDNMEEIIIDAYEEDPEQASVVIADQLQIIADALRENYPGLNQRIKAYEAKLPKRKAKP